jgi:diguanylate cyclase (GGDEF)-like protein/PAS domain S-box-containing protein
MQGSLNELSYARKVADSISGMLAYWDQEQLCRYANHAYLDWFGKTSADMINKMTLEDLLGPLYQKNLPFIEAAYGGVPQEFERDIPTPQGKIRQSLATYTPDVEDGRVKGIIVQVVDVTYLKDVERRPTLAMEKAESLATHDFLTGLPNRVLLNDRIGNAILVAERKRSRVAVCVMDMDGFKAVNDSFGHLAGDAVLKEVAERFTSALRPYDSMARLGGDEFVIMFPDATGQEDVRCILDRILKATTLPFEIGGGVIRPSFSLGVAFYPEHGKGVEELIRAADMALYASKERGRNCYTFCS